jgi:hypothetical protein
LDSTPKNYFTIPDIKKPTTGIKQKNFIKKKGKINIRHILNYYLENCNDNEIQLKIQNRINLEDYLDLYNYTNRKYLIERFFIIIIIKKLNLD